MICVVKRCRQESELVYYGHEVCDKHWLRHCDPTDSFDLKKELKVIQDD